MLKLIYGFFKGVGDDVLGGFIKDWLKGLLGGDSKKKEQQALDAESVRGLVAPLIESAAGRASYPQLYAALNHPHRILRERIQRVILSDAKLFLFSEASDPKKEKEKEAEDDQSVYNRARYR